MNKTELGKQTYENLCKAFELIGFKFERNDEKLSVACVCSGDDLRINIFMRVDGEAHCVSLFSAMPYTISKDKISEAALAVCSVNSKIKFGKFDVDPQSGAIDYNFCNYYDNAAAPSPQLFKFLLMVALHTVDKYNDKFLNLNRGVLSVEDFLTAGDNNIKS